MRPPGRTLQVFEHDRLVVGHRHVAQDGSEVVFDRSAFDALCAFNESNGSALFEIGHQSIRFRQFVGLIQLPRLGLEILPKVHRAQAGSPGLWQELLLTMIRLGTRLRPVPAGSASLHAARLNLVDVFAAAYLDEVSLVMRHGLRRGYRTVEQNRSHFRGRLLAGQNARRNAFHAERFYVAFQEFDYDTPENRILRAALAVLRDLPLSPHLAQRTREAQLVFPEVAPPHVDANTFRHLRADRTAAHYQRALDLARMLLLQEAPDLRWGRRSIVSILFDMNVLFERFVAALFRRAVPHGWTVETQTTRAFWTSGRTTRSLRPDLVLRGPRGAVVVDTKWKVPDGDGPAHDDLKQMYAYHHRFETPRTLLLYPRASSGQTAVTGAFFRDGLRCDTAYLSLSQGTHVDVDGMVRQLRALVDE